MNEVIEYFDKKANVYEKGTKKPPPNSSINMLNEAKQNLAHINEVIYHLMDITESTY